MKKRSREPKQLPPVLVSATGPALIKHLASCNTTVRSQSLRLIHSWLAAESQQLSEFDINRLWKGLFYCLWHADKTHNQVALIDRLTSLFLSLQPSISLEFFRGLLVTLRREWSGIDRLRLDKFYLLIRRFMRALFELMRLTKWDVGSLGEYLRVLEKDGLLAEDKLQGNGVSYHVVSVFLEELTAVGFPVRMEVVDVILRPFLAVMMRSKDKILVGKVKGCLFDKLLKMGKELLAKKKTGVDFDENDGDALLGIVALRMGLSERFYEVGSFADCIQGNRKAVLGLHEEFLKLEKELELSGVETSIPEYSYAGSDAADDKVPQVIPIEFDESKSHTDIEGSEETQVACDEDQLDCGVFKKSKKARKGTGGDDKKRKKKKKKKKEDDVISEINYVFEENGDLVSVNCSDNLQSPTYFENGLSDGTAVDLNGTMISNLHKQFEKVAAIMDSETYKDSDSSGTPVGSTKKVKRKRAKGADFQDSGDLNINGTGDDGVETAAKSEDKSAKKVRFSMKNNLVWKPQNPLPPESLRLPPSVTPRGSALKKGLAPGPIVEMPSVAIKVKRKKKAKKILKNATLAKQRWKKVQKQYA